MKMKLVINVCFGGFTLSEKASVMLNKRKNLKKSDNYYIEPKYGNFHGERYDKDLVYVVETLKEEASGDFSQLEVVSIKGPRFIIDNYDGNESVLTPENMNWKVIDTPKARLKFPEYFL